MQSLKDLALAVSEKKTTLQFSVVVFFSNEVICQLSPLNMCETQN